jgi:membrane protein
MQRERRFSPPRFYLARATDIKVIHLVIVSGRSFTRHDMSMYAAALAYHILFSLFPFVIFLLALLSYFDLHKIFASITGQAQLVLPQPATAQIHMVLGKITKTTEPFGQIYITE